MEISIKCECGKNHSINHYNKEKGIINSITIFCNCDKTYSSEYNLKKGYKITEDPNIKEVFYGKGNRL